MTKLAKTWTAGAAVFLGALITSGAFASSHQNGNASGGTPQCLDQSGNEVTAADSQVLTWEQTTANQFLARANVEGNVVAVYPDQTGHAHFAIQIGANSDQTLEVIYDLEFGAIPQVQVGMHVQACGDYITSNQATQNYPISPCGAIIHWIHMSPKPASHPNGFLMLNGQVYGQNYPKN